MAWDYRAYLKYLAKEDQLFTLKQRLKVKLLPLAYGKTQTLSRLGFGERNERLHKHVNN
jgi:hypothetical protein